ncbi:DNA-binding domain-containing protein [Actinophytocola oryzae]|uniref:Putative DNA-binding protein n=1 Tax=Actinophytocola oryzae TaxID=502181 RepID=A0A4R7W1R1_9PSEU|nr:DNA-binding domain-containing protein [Actinophytocola oryzae]TDV56352.1 putative DNA-binding protein [Actinophytocola oryzae]
MVQPDLATLQEWLLNACTGAGNPGTCRASEVVRGSDRLTADERLTIYALGYRARLRECLKAEFPALHALVGEQVFGLFADGYVAAHPPRSHSMFDLGARFADFLDETRPNPREPPGSLDALPTALARLERARAECRRARGVESDPARPVDPLEVMTTPDMTIRTPPTLRLLRLDFPLLDTLTAADHGDRPSIPDPADTYYAVARTHYRVRVHVVTRWQHTFLHTCATGVALHTAVSATADACALDLPRLWAALVTWLPVAVDAGMASRGAHPMTEPAGPRSRERTSQ